jgi:hypothetical protein
MTGNVVLHYSAIQKFMFVSGSVFVLIIQRWQGGGRYLFRCHLTMLRQQFTVNHFFMFVSWNFQEY